MVTKKTQKSQLSIAFGKMVREKRMYMDISQERFASIAGIHRNYMGLIERGEKNVTLEVIAKIAKVFNLEPYELLKNLKKK